MEHGHGTVDGVARGAEERRSSKACNPDGKHARFGNWPNIQSIALSFALLSQKNGFAFGFGSSLFGIEPSPFGYGSWLFDLFALGLPAFLACSLLALLAVWLALFQRCSPYALFALALSAF